MKRSSERPRVPTPYLAGVKRLKDYGETSGIKTEVLPTRSLSPEATLATRNVWRADQEPQQGINEEGLKLRPTNVLVVG